MNTIKRLLFLTLRFSSHLGALGIIFILFLPAAGIFLFDPQLIGVDTPHFLYYVIEFSRRSPFPPAGWKMTWFEGTPQMLDYPWLNYYLIQPLVHLFGVLPATKIYLIGAHFIFVAFSYLVFVELSGGILLSIALVAGIVCSYTTFIQLYSAGATLSAISQIAFPATFFFLLRYFKKGNKRWFGLGILSMAFGFYSHDLTTLFFSFIPIIIFLGFYTLENERFFSKRKFGDILSFALGTLFLSAPPLVVHIIDFFTGINVKVSFTAFGAGSSVGFKDLFTSVDYVFYLLLPVSLIGLLFGKIRRKLRTIWPLLAILIYFLLFHVTYALKINPVIGVLFPHRSFWLLPIILGALISILWSLEKGAKFWSKIIVWIVAGVSLVAATSYGSKPLDPNLKDRGELKIIKLITQGLPHYDWKIVFEKEKAPEPYISMMNFFGSKDLNHRMYNYNSGIRIGWNMFSLIPQTHGYYHYFTPDNTDWLAWLYASFSKQNYEEGGIPEDIATQQSLFLADWYATAYIATYIPLLDDVAPHFYQDNQTVVERSATQAPAMIKMSPDYVSELARPTKSSVVGFVGDRQSYDFFMRNLGILNLNSMYVIPIDVSNYVDALTEEKLSSLDGLVFYNYRKKVDGPDYQLAWKKVEKFVQDGGMVFIENGADSPEKYGEKIPDIFPISSLRSGSLGTEWNTESDFFAPEDFANLSPLTYQEDVWTLTFAEDSDIKSGTKVLLRQGGKAVLVESQKGKGKIIWSGLNTFYRPLHHQDTALAEDAILKKILAELFVLERQKVEFGFSRGKPEHVILTFTGGHGALLKENNYGGWIALATVGRNKVRLPILSAGTYFMYAPLPKEYWNQTVKVEFIYRGTPINWLLTIISIISLVFVLDMIFAKQKIFNSFYKPFRTKIENKGVEIKERWNEE